MNLNEKMDKLDYDLWSMNLTLKDINSKLHELNRELEDKAIELGVAFRCGECETVYFSGEDERVENGLKCGRCSYEK